VTRTTPDASLHDAAPKLQDEIDRLLAAVAPKANAKVARELLTAAVALATDDVERLDLKIATAALTEMRDAFRVFAPYHDVPKVTIFGSARTRPDDPVYDQARRSTARRTIRAIRRVEFPRPDAARSFCHAWTWTGVRVARVRVPIRATLRGRLLARCRFPDAASWASFGESLTPAKDYRGSDRGTWV
jgi:hypothetical protein